MRSSRFRRRSSSQQPIFVTVASGVIRRNVGSRGERGGGGRSTPNPVESIQMDRPTRDEEVAALAKTLQVDFIPNYLDYMFYVGGSIYTHAAVRHSRLVKRLNKVKWWASM